MASDVQFHIGPVGSDMALAWIANSRALVSAVERDGHDVSIETSPHLLELCTVLLDVWESHARTSEVFDWSMSTSSETVLGVVRQWLEIGRLSGEELARLGCTWAPEWTRPFADAVVVGAVDALRQVGPPGEELLSRLEGSAT